MTSPAFSRQTFPDGTKAIGDLPEVSVSAAGTLAASVRSAVSASGTYTAPAVTSVLTVPPQRFAIRNDTTGAITLQMPNRAGTVLPLTILPGEDRIYRQTTTSGYSIDGGTPLRYFDERYFADLLIASGPATLSNLAADTWYIADSTSASLTYTLPTGTYNGAQLIVENIGTANAITVNAGGQDTIEGSASVTVAPGAYVHLTYWASQGQWRRRRSTPEATAGTDARRNASGQISVGTPTASDHAVTKAYADGLSAGGKTVLTEFASFPGSLSLYVGQGRWYNDTGRTLTISSIRASVGTAPTGAAIIVDVNKNGTTLFTTQANRPTIAVSTNTIKRTNMDVTTVADGDYLTTDIDQIGSTIPGADLALIVVMS